MLSNSVEKILDDSSRVLAVSKTVDQQTTVAREKQSSNPLRLLDNKLVFLDLNTYKMLNKVKECLRLIDVVSFCCSIPIKLNLSHKYKNHKKENSRLSK